MRFLIEINCDNDAFVGEESTEVADILVRLAQRLDHTGVPPAKLRDRNNNAVGVAYFEYDEEN